MHGVADSTGRARPGRSPEGGRVRRPSGAIARLALAATRALATALALAPAVATAQQPAEAVDRSALRVCADPGNIPFSNTAGEGFENKIAELLAAELGVPVKYTWFPQATGFIRNTLNARVCDIVIGVSLGFELAQNTNPYYRSAYALIYPDRPALAGLSSLDDPRLKDLRIGVVAGTPPATALAVNGLMGHVRPYQLMVDTRFDSSGRDMVKDIAAGAIDVGILWGPIGGYFARSSDPPLKVVPLVTQKGGPRLDYLITMAVRHNEPEWKREINRLIRDKQDQITAILLDYGVPLLDAKGDPITR